MNRLPVELWTQIFLFACVDGGGTGCALSETCHYFRDVVLPVQLHSVALVGGLKTQAFLDVLEGRAAENRCVEHLFTSQGRESRLALDMVQRLFEFLAPTLRTFTSTLPQTGLRIDRASVLTHSFPRLEELTMHGYLNLLENLPLARGVALQPFPALKRLHVLSSCDSALFIAKRAPSLTHLRLSGVCNMSDALYMGIACFLGADVAPAQDQGLPSASTDEPGVLPETIKQIIIEPDWKIARFFWGQNHARAGAFHRLKMAERQGVFSLLETKVNSRGMPNDARKGWEERIVGGGGCWTVSRGEDVQAQSRIPRHMEI